MAPGSKIHIGWYIVSDYLAAASTWVLLFFIRKQLMNEPLYINGRLDFNDRFTFGLAFMPLAWVIFYFLMGSYHSLYKKSRLTELTHTFLFSLIGCAITAVYFVLRGASRPMSYYYTAFQWFVLLQSLLTFTGRVILLTIVKRQLHRG